MAQAHVRKKKKTKKKKSKLAQNPEAYEHLCCQTHSGGLFTLVVATVGSTTSTLSDSEALVLVRDSRPAGGGVAGGDGPAGDEMPLAVGVDAVVASVELEDRQNHHDPRRDETGCSSMSFSATKKGSNRREEKEG